MEMKHYELDFDSLYSTEEVQQYIAQELDLPNWYGRNLDALYDSLTDLGKCEIVLKNTESLEGIMGVYGEKILKVFEDVAEEGRLTLEIE